MLNQKFFGFSLTTWIVIVVIIFYFFYCTQCNMENFASEVDETLDDETNNDVLKIYNFNTSWCGYSKKFQPIWDEFSQKHKNKDNVVIMDVKCDDEGNAEAQELCEAFDVPGYPSIIFKKGDNKLDYMGPRTIDGLEEQMNKLL